MQIDNLKLQSSYLQKCQGIVKQILLKYLKINMMVNLSLASKSLNKTIDTNKYKDFDNLIKQKSNDCFNFSIIIREVNHLSNDQYH